MAPQSPAGRHLSRTDFLKVVECAPLVSIDLIVRRPGGDVLLGLRKNEPARHCWFAPGGRIWKDERFSAAFRRVCRTELGLEVELEQARFRGVFEHFYPTNAGGVPGFGTHYVVLAYELSLTELPAALPAEQHGEYRWFDVPTLLRTPEVHEHVKAYFR
jgi:colanic acid biosynthesis protein WcaH